MKQITLEIKKVRPKTRNRMRSKVCEMLFKRAHEACAGVARLARILRYTKSPISRALYAKSEYHGERVSRVGTRVRIRFGNDECRKEIVIHVEELNREIHAQAKKQRSVRGVWEKAALSVAERIRVRARAAARLTEYENESLKESSPQVLGTALLVVIQNLFIRSESEEIVTRDEIRKVPFAAACLAAGVLSRMATSMLSERERAENGKIAKELLECLF